MVADTIAARAAAGDPVAVCGFLNDEVRSGDEIGGVPVLGGFDDWRALAPGVRFVAAFPRPGDALGRHLRLRSLGIPDDRWETVLDPHALVSPRARLGAGRYVA